MHHVEFRVKSNSSWHRKTGVQYTRITSCSHEPNGRVLVSAPIPHMPVDTARGRQAREALKSRRRRPCGLLCSTVSFVPANTRENKFQAKDSYSNSNFPNHGVSDSFERSQLCHFALSFSTREGCEWIKTIFVLAFVLLFSFGAYSNASTLSTTLKKRKNRRRHVKHSHHLVNEPIIFFKLTWMQFYLSRIALEETNFFV